MDRTFQWNCARVSVMLALQASGKKYISKIESDCFSGSASSRFTMVSTKQNTIFADFGFHLALHNIALLTAC